MIEIHGKSGCLKYVHTTLLESGITEFESVKQLNDFVATYNQKIKELRIREGKAIEDEIEDFQQNKLQLEKDRYSALDTLDKTVSPNIKSLDSRLSKYRNKSHDPIFKKLFNYIRRSYSKYKLNKTKSHLDTKAQSITNKYNKEIDMLNSKIIEYSTETNKIIDQNIKLELDRLTYVKQKIEDLNPFIAGAIGEHKVVKRLEQLSIDGILINDYQLKFKPATLYPTDKTKIHSIQLDHLLITGAGVFILETKNWSEKSVQDQDLRSPVAQINRSSYALFRFLNDSKDIRINKHHWGQKEVSIRNIIVMVKNKPNVKFKFVKIKALNELNNYIKYFPDQFAPNEVRSIGDFLLNNQDKSIVSDNRSKPKARRIMTINDMYRDQLK